MSHACMEALVRIQHLINIVARVPKACRAFVVKLLSIRAPHNRAKMAARVPWRYHFVSILFDYLSLGRCAIIITAARSLQHAFIFCFSFFFRIYLLRGHAWWLFAVFRLKRHLPKLMVTPSYAPHFEIREKKNRVRLLNGVPNAFHAFEVLTWHGRATLLICTIHFRLVI